MIVEVLGKRYAEGTNKKGQPYRGFFVSIGYKQANVEGLQCEQKFFSTELLQGIVPEVGGKLDIENDFNGFPRSVKHVFDSPLPTKGTDLNAGK